METKHGLIISAGSLQTFRKVVKEVNLLQKPFGIHHLLIFIVKACVVFSSSACNTATQKQEQCF